LEGGPQEFRARALDWVAAAEEAMSLLSEFGGEFVPHAVAFGGDEQGETRGMPAGLGDEEAVELGPYGVGEGALPDTLHLLLGEAGGLDEIRVDLAGGEDGGELLVIHPDEAAEAKGLGGDRGEQFFEECGVALAPSGDG